MKMRWQKNGSVTIKKNSKKGEQINFAIVRREDKYLIGNAIHIASKIEFK